MSLPKLGKLKLNDYSLDLDHYLTGEYDDIGEACTEIPPIVEWVNDQLQCYTEQKLIADHAIKVAEAKAYFELRNGGFEDRGYAGKCTEVALERAVALDQGVIDAHENYAVLVGWVKRLENLQGSLQTKLDLIRSTEATRRRIYDSSEKDQ